MCKSNCKTKVLEKTSRSRPPPYFHEEETHHTHHAAVFHARETSRCTHAGNDGEKLISRETPSSHNDPVPSDFQGSSGAEEYGDGLFLGTFIFIRIYTFNSLLAVKLLDASEKSMDQRAGKRVPGNGEQTSQG